ncbi:MAG TPA: hypothetical protein VNT51_12120, partial [Miltoncostaeaceae bacterium]|nr:hypothetical protein [Miltoncostaeaceae bacterium]
LARIRARLDRLVPPPVRPIPLLMGSGGERVGLRLVAENAQAWNWFGTPEAWRAKSRVLDDWCARVGRDPGAIERSVLVSDPAALARVDEYVAAGCGHVIVGLAAPFDLAPVRGALARLGRG